MQPRTTSRPSDVFFGGGPSEQNQSADSASQRASKTADQRSGIGEMAMSAAGKQSAQASSTKKPAGKASTRQPQSQTAADTPLGDQSELVAVPGASFAEIPAGEIVPNPKQPRAVFEPEELAELAASIQEVGLLQPIIVRPAPQPSGSTKPATQYELVMGERRWRAAQQAGLTAIPAIIRQTADQDMLRDALLENLHRAQLNPLEEAAAYQQLLEDFGCTQQELAKRIARSRPQISNTLRLLKLPPAVQRRLAAGVISAGHARALLTLQAATAMEQLASRIVAEGLSVRTVEEIVALGGDKPLDLTEQAEEPLARRQPRPGQRAAELDALQDRLTDRFDTRVTVQLGKTKGRVSIEFASVADLNRILAVLAPDDPGLFAEARQ
jgi:ParB family chromosome partitioning protein